MNLNSHILTAQRQLKKLQKIHPTWNGFKIMRGDFARGNDMIHCEIIEPWRNSPSFTGHKE